MHHYQIQKLIDAGKIYIGGTGFFEINGPTLPDMVEHFMPDYHLYDEYIRLNSKATGGKPDAKWSDYLNFSIGFTTRGCIRQCGFCVNRLLKRVVEWSPVSEFYDRTRSKIYWAMKFIKFRKSDSDEEVTDKFYEVISEFLEEESNDEQNTPSANESISDDDTDEVYLDEAEEAEGTEQESSTSTLSSDGLELLCYLNWKSKGCPIGSDSAAKKFQKECFYLLDRLLYEYVSGVWKGSGDSRIRNNIENLSENFRPVPKDDWKNLLAEIFDNSKINGVDIKLDLMKPLLYHFYCLNNQAGPNTLSTQFDVDHIIPQALFNLSTYERRESLRDNLLNLGILPKQENCSKGKKRLIEITDSWMKSMIREYEFIEESDFYNFSDVENYSTMFAKRRPIFENAFLANRSSLINN